MDEVTLSGGTYGGELVLVPASQDQIEINDEAGTVWIYDRTLCPAEDRRVAVLVGTRDAP